MKKFVSIIIVSLFLFSCTKEAEPEFFDLGKEEKFKIGIENKSAQNGVKLTITNVQESRCPSDVTCVWEGEAKVEIEFISPFEETIELSTYDDLIDTVSNYSIELLDVLPYPVSTHTTELDDYTVILKIVELGD